jgi:hypothetical protein
LIDKEGDQLLFVVVCICGVYEIGGAKILKGFCGGIVLFELLGHGCPIISKHVLEEISGYKVRVHVDLGYLEDSSDDVYAEARPGDG